MGDILVLAGDIAYLGKDYAKHPFWDWASEHYSHMAVIPAATNSTEGSIWTPCTRAGSSRSGRTQCLSNQQGYIRNGKRIKSEPPTFGGRLFHIICVSLKGQIEKLYRNCLF